MALPGAQVQDAKAAASDGGEDTLVLHLPHGFAILEGIAMEEGQCLLENFVIQRHGAPVAKWVQGMKGRRCPYLTFIPGCAPSSGARMKISAPRSGGQDHPLGDTEVQADRGSTRVISGLNWAIST